MEAMKNGLGPKAIDRIASSLKQVYPEFDSVGFKTQSTTGLESLELKQRVDHIIQVLSEYLPASFEEAASILLELPRVWDKGEEDDPMSGFAAWPVTDYSARFGSEHVDLSLSVLETLTPLFSAEFAIRPFITAHPKRLLLQLKQWCKHDSEHVRRLASEGCRPRLPWGVRLHKYVENPKPILPILESLKKDESLYVRRSVANSLNDISKDHPNIVISLCKEWLDEGATEETKWLIRHASRGLVKAGHKEAFELLGYTANPVVKVSDIHLNSTSVKIGDKLNFEFAVSSQKAGQHFVLDYAVHYRKANGNLSPKVFKLKNVRLGESESTTINKDHSFKVVTTRRLYPGLHRLVILVNGVEQVGVDFELLS